MAEKEMRYIETTQKKVKPMESLWESYSCSGESCLCVDGKERVWCPTLQCSSCEFMGPDMFWVKDVLIVCRILAKGMSISSVQ